MSAASVAVVARLPFLRGVHQMHLVNATKERQAWCCLQVKLRDPRLSALSVVATIKALYKYTSFLSFLFHSPQPDTSLYRETMHAYMRGLCIHVVCLFAPRLLHRYHTAW